MQHNSALKKPTIGFPRIPWLVTGAVVLELISTLILLSTIKFFYDQARASDYVAINWPRAFSECVGFDLQEKRSLDENRKLLVDGLTRIVVGKLQEQNQDQPKAEQNYREALVAFDEFPGKDGLITCYSRTLLVDCLIKGRKYQEAENLLKVAIPEAERAFNKDHGAVSSMVKSLAGVYQMEGRHREAIPLWQRAIAIDGKGLGGRSSVVVRDLDSLATEYGLVATCTKGSH